MVPELGLRPRFGGSMRSYHRCNKRWRILPQWRSQGQVVVFGAKFVYRIRSGPERALREITACKASSVIPHTIGETDTPCRQQYMTLVKEINLADYVLRLLAGDHRRSGFTDRDRDRVRRQTLHRSLGAAPGCQPDPAGHRRRAAADRPRRRSLLIPPQRKCSAKPLARLGLPRLFS
jgi:hypothetical protein